MTNDTTRNSEIGIVRATLGINGRGTFFSVLRQTAGKLPFCEINMPSISNLFRSRLSTAQLCFKCIPLEETLKKGAVWEEGSVVGHTIYVIGLDWRVNRWLIFKVYSPRMLNVCVLVLQLFKWLIIANDMLLKYRCCVFLFCSAIIYFCSFTSGNLKWTFISWIFGMNFFVLSVCFLWEAFSLLRGHCEVDEQSGGWVGGQVEK